ncbi:E3 ubiquitin-protein ligase LRSAM1 [Halotydeus destructor]|nr:E3 ubiquitin-protein ligase LRSAM1 [Halotydeus destructor]
MSIRSLFRKGSSEKKTFQSKLHLAQTTPDPIIDLSDCGLTDVPNGVFSMCKVYRKEQLILSNNQIKTLPDDKNNRLASLSETVLVLELSHNAISNLCQDYSRLNSLQELYLNNNKIKSLPNEFAKLMNLVKLEMRCNFVKVFPSVLISMRKLELIDLRENQISMLPGEVSSMSQLKTLLIDSSAVTNIPDKRVLKEAANVTREIECVQLPSAMADEQMTNTRLNSDDDQEKIDYDAYSRLLTKKEQKRTEKLQWEKDFMLENNKQFQLASKLKLEKRSFLQELADEQELLEADLVGIQMSKAKDKQSLIKIMSDLESHAEDVIMNVTRWQEKKNAQLKILSDLEQHNLELFLHQDENITLRKEIVLKSIEYLVSEGMMESLEGETERFRGILQGKQINRDKLRTQLLQEEELQKAAFEILQRSRDDHHRFVSNQIKLVEKELASLTLAEIRKKSLKLDMMVNDVSHQRTVLASLLAELIREKEQRERDLNERTRAMEKYHEDECENDDYWLLQYQKLLHREPMRDQLAQLGLDKDERLVMALTKCDEDKLEKYLHIFFDNAICKLEDLVGKSEKEMMSLGIHDYELARDIVQNVQEIWNQGAASAPLLEEEPSAPPMDVYCEVDCVICLDSASAVIFIPCGHFCCCKACSSGLHQCPLCRVNISTKFNFNMHF